MLVRAWFFFSKFARVCVCKRDRIPNPEMSNVTRGSTSALLCAPPPPPGACPHAWARPISTSGISGKNTIKRGKRIYWPENGKPHPLANCLCHTQPIPKKARAASPAAPPTPESSSGSDESGDDEAFVNELLFGSN